MSESTSKLPPHPCADQGPQLQLSMTIFLQAQSRPSSILPLIHNSHPLYKQWPRKSSSSAATASLVHPCPVHPKPYPLTNAPGSRICKVAIARGHTVTSLSRSGEPQWSSVTSSLTAPSWSKSVQWQKSDMLVPSTYRVHLAGADAVVHSTGILLEADYKGVISGKESPISGLKRAFSAHKMGARNPLDREQGEELRSQERDGQLTYELMNRDSGECPLLISCVCALLGSTGLMG